MKQKLLIVAGMLVSLSAFAQTSVQATVAVSPAPIYRVSVISRTIQVVSKIAEWSCWYPAMQLADQP